MFACYTAVHYAPAVLSSDKVLGVGGPASQSATLDDRSRNPIAPYLELFELDRTYLRSGQGIRAEYKVRPGAFVELEVVRCQSALVVEVFKCVPVEYSDHTVSGGAGSRVFRFEDAGFYHFKDSGTGDYRVVWSRA